MDVLRQRGLWVSPMGHCLAPPRSSRVSLGYRELSPDLPSPETSPRPTSRLCSNPLTSTGATHEAVSSASTACHLHTWRCSAAFSSPFSTLICSLWGHPAAELQPRAFGDPLLDQPHGLLLPLASVQALMASCKGQAAACPQTWPKARPAEKHTFTVHERTDTRDVHAVLSTSQAPAWPQPHATYHDRSTTCQKHSP